MWLQLWDSKRADICCLHLDSRLICFNYGNEAQTRSISWTKKLTRSGLAAKTASELRVHLVRPLCAAINIPITL